MIELKKIIILLLVLLACGCSKKLTCTYELEYEDVEIDNKIVFDLKNNTYKEKDVMTFEDEEDAKEYFKDVEEYVEEYNLVLEKNKIVSELEGDIEKTTKKELKEKYEGYDYKCK